MNDVSGVLVASREEAEGDGGARAVAPAAVQAAEQVTGFLQANKERIKYREDNAVATIISYFGLQCLELLSDASGLRRRDEHRVQDVDEVPGNEEKASTLSQPWHHWVV